jgi:uncharacterized protein YhaN
MKLLKIIGLITVLFCMLCMWEAVHAQNASIAAKPKAEPAIKVSDQDKAELKQASDQYSQLAQTQATLEAQLDAVKARRASLESGFAAKFNRLCAKAKVDPDLYQWTKDLDGIELKPVAK